MGWEDISDPVLDALQLVCLARVNAALGPHLGAGYQPLRFTREYPIPLDQVPTLTLPGMAIYRRRERGEARGKHVDWNTRVEFQYWAPPTLLNKLNERWPLLHAVAEQVFLALQDGTDPSSGEDVFRPAGIVKVDDVSWEVEYNFATDSGGQNAFPVFLAAMNFSVRPATPATDLPWLREMLAHYHLQGHGDNPIVSDLVELPGPFEYSLITDAGEAFITDDGNPIVGLEMGDA